MIINLDKYRQNIYNNLVKELQEIGDTYIYNKDNKFYAIGYHLTDEILVVLDKENNITVYKEDKVLEEIDKSKTKTIAMLLMIINS